MPQTAPPYPYPDAPTPVPPPSRYAEELRVRASDNKFRRIGNPYSFLDSIGISAIKEHIYRGNMVIDVAEILNVSVSVLRHWLKENQYEDEVEEASILSAEGYLSRGERLLQDASNKFELDKAKAVIEHGRFMASKKDKKTYGQQLTVQGTLASVHYMFNVGTEPPKIIDVTPPQNNETKQIAVPIEEEATDVYVPLVNLLPLDEPE